MTMNSSDVTAGDNGTATQYNNLRKDVRNGNKIITTATDGATVTFDLSVSNIQQVTLEGNRTLAVSNVVAGQVFILKIIQDAVGSRVPTFFSTIRWIGGSAPPLTTTATKADVFGFICTGTNTYDGFIVGMGL